MKPFRFALQPLRVLREQHEQAAQKQYADRLRDCEEAAARVRGVSAELDEAWTGLRTDLGRGVSASQLQRARSWCSVLELRLKERTRDFEAARIKADACWQELLAATRDREALDHFHDRQRRAHDREVQRAEQNVLDEMAVQMAGTSARDGGAGHTPMSL